MGKKKKVVRFFQLNPINRISKHYEAICSEISPLSDTAQEEFSYFKDRFEYYERHAKFTLKVKFVVLVLLYASVIVNIISALPLDFLPFLSDIVLFLETSSTLIGTTILLFALYYITNKLNLYQVLMSECLKHLVVLYHLSDSRDTSKALLKMKDHI